MLIDTIGSPLHWGLVALVIALAALLAVLAVVLKASIAVAPVKPTSFDRSVPGSAHHVRPLAERRLTDPERVHWG